MDFVTIRTFQNNFSAHLVLTKLRSAGITCFLKDEFTVTVDPILSNAIGGIKLVIKKEEQEEAIELLRVIDEDYIRSAVCLRCGKHTIELVPKNTTKNLASVLLSWILGSYAVSPKNVYQCSSCKYESETLPESFNNDLEEYNEETLN
jgi:DNA-directed RNA polymerase subunit RPC12/RpoP